MTTHDAFDARLRAAHAASLAHLSPRVQAQLAQRRRAAPAAPGPGRARPAFGLALATLAVCAVAVGVFRQDGRAPAAGPLAAADAVAPAPDSFEDNPDFYLWLASRDADSLAAE
ncbi:MAG: hypothetical protein ACTHKZ_03835 [Lysobacteraceae bacterium]